MTVFVRWYGKVLEGDMLDGEWMGMKQVRIPLDGHYPVALFTPQHVYESADHPDLIAFDTRTARLTEVAYWKETEQKSFEVKVSPPLDILPSHDRKVLELYKTSNWDHERNHLRVDKLDEFYRLWRETMTPDGFVDAKTPASSLIRKDKNNKCQDCRCWVHTTTLGSPIEPEWHCRHGFTPSKDCLDMAAYNDECMRNDPKQRPADYTETSQPSQKHATQKIKKPSKKMLRSTGRQQFSDATQLALFD